MGIAVLGPLEVGGRASTLGLRDRVVLEALAAQPGVAVSPDSLAEAIWGGAPPASWAKVIQGCVMRLRKVLGREAIETSSRGYLLRVHVDHLDTMRFEHLIGRARELLALAEPERAAYLLGEALSLWRGDPFTELAGWGPGRVELERLVELREDAEDLRTEALLRCGRLHEALAAAVRLVREAPFRERRWGLLALAQYQDGRQRDAMDTLHRARAVLVNELGLDPGPELTSLERAILRQDPSLAVSTALPAPSPVCPYLGLVAYDIRDAGAYFGRAAEIAACLERLDSAGVLAIVGPSGCGKSSLARAGVAAALERDGRRVRVVVPGARPGDVLTAAPGGARGVLVVDQCEEALAPEVPEAERAAFFAALADFAASGQLILTLRADRLGDISTYPAFAHLVESGLCLLGPMRADDLRRAIEGPAEQAGFLLEPGLADLLVQEVERAPGALPLLSHVMRQTWTRREGSTLTVAGYRATGGVTEAVSQSAENLFRGMTPRQQGMLRDLMLRLVVSDDSGEPVRTRAPRGSVAPDEEHTAVIESLVSARLLSSDGDTVEIAHESLAIAWPRLRSWLDDDVEGLRIMRHLSVAAHSWDELGRPTGELYRGVRQAKAEQWRTASTPSLTPTERDFLDESAALAQAEARATEEQVRLERRSNRRLRAGLASVAVLLALAIVAGAVAETAADRADQQSVEADARRLGAEALRTSDQDLALLLAAAGATLDDSPDTRNNLGAVLDRAPELIGIGNPTAAMMMSLRADGRAVAMTEWETGVTLFDAQTRKEVARNDDIPTRDVRFNPNGKQLAASVNVTTSTGERRVDPVPLRMLDPQTAATAPTQLGGMPKGRVVQEAFAFSTNGRWLAAGFEHPNQLDQETWIRVWDTGDLARPTAAFTVPFRVGWLAVSNKGTKLYAGADDMVHSLDVTAGRVDRSQPAGDIALSPDGSTLAAGRGRQIVMLHPDRLTVKSVIEEDGTVGGPMAFSPNGDRLGYSVDGILVVRSLAEPGPAGIRLDGLGSSPNDIGFSPDGRTLYGAGGSSLLDYEAGDRLLVWDLVGDRRFVRSVPVQPQPDSADIVGTKISPDGQKVASFVSLRDGPESYTVQLLDLRSGTRNPPSASRASNTYYWDMVWRPDGRMVASAQDDQWVDLWDGATGQRAGRHRVPDRYGVVNSVAFSGDSTRLVVHTRSSWVYAVDVSTLQVVGEPVEGKAGTPAYGVAANGDGTRAMVRVDRRLQLLDLEAGRVAQSVDPRLDDFSWAWSPDDKAVVVAGTNRSHNGHGTVAFLDTDTLATTDRFSGPQVAGGFVIQFSSDGTRFTTSGSDRVGLWNMHPRRYLGSVRAEGDSTVGFAQGTSDVLIASIDGRVSVWDPDPGAAIEAACRIAGRHLTDAEWRAYLPERELVQVCAS
jgi:WD40 repeat protein/DNA-binding SARP family transcriptional activator